jgi:hypothetical protein
MNTVPFLLPDLRMSFVCRFLRLWNGKRTGL